MESKKKLKLQLIYISSLVSTAVVTMTATCAIFYLNANLLTNKYHNNNI